MTVAPSRPPRADETPLCTIVISNYRSARRGDETPLYTYVPGSSDWCRIEPAVRRRGDAAPSYVPASEAQLQIPEEIRFGDWLVRRGLINRRELYSALTLARSRSIRLGDALVELRVIDRPGIEEEASAHGTFGALQRGAPLMAPRG